MTGFWIIVAAMLAIALWVLLRPLWRRRTGPLLDVDREALNVALFKEQVAELNADLTNGLLNQEQFEGSKADLEQSLLYDLEGRDKSKSLPVETTKSSPGRWAAILLVGVGLPIFSVWLYLQLGASGLLPILEAGAGEKQAAANPHEGAGAAAGNQPSVEEMVAGLAARMKQNPDDGKGWHMLARSYAVTGQFKKSQDAYEQAFRLLPDDPDVMVGYAEIMALTNNRSLQGRPTELLEQALKIQPDHHKANWLRGFAYYQQGAYPMAVKTWERLRSAYMPGSEEANNIAQMIRDAKAKMGIVEPEAKVAAASQVEPRATQATQAISKGKQISVTVSLDPALAGKVKPTDTLFVLARALSGPPMPLAVVRKTAADLPLKLTLNDSMAMSPAMKLSSFPQVKVEARISRSGNAIRKSGDLSGIRKPVRPGSGEAVEVVIDTLVP